MTSAKPNISLPRPMCRRFLFALAVASLSLLGSPGVSAQGLDSDVCQQEGEEGCAAPPVLNGLPESEPRAQYADPSQAGSEKRRKRTPRPTPTKKPRPTKKPQPTKGPSNTPATGQNPTPKPTDTPVSRPSATPTVTPSQTPTPVPAAPPGPADCSKSGPQVSCTTVKTPCDFSPGRAFSACNGGMVTSFPMNGGIALFHNSHKDGDSNLNVGFGLGVSYASYVEVVGADLRVVSPDRSTVTFKAAGNGTWQSPTRQAGDLSVVRQSQNGYEFAPSDGTLTRYSNRVGFGARQVLFVTSVKDVIGNETRFEYVKDGSPILKRIVWPTGLETAAITDSSGVLVSEIRDPDGIPTKLVYSSSDPARALLREVVLPDGKRIRVEYDEPFNLITRLTDAFGREQNFAYAVQPGGHAVLTTQSSPEGVNTFSYTTACVSVKAPTSFARQWFTRSDSSDPTSVYLSDIDTGADEPTSKLVFAERRDAEGKRVSTTDENGFTTRYFYGAQGDLQVADLANDLPFPTAVLAHDGSFERITRDASVRFAPVKVERLSAKGELISSSALSWFDEGRRPAKMTVTSASSGAVEEQLYTYTEGSYGPTKIATRTRKTYRYDSKNRLVGGEKPDGDYSIEYDSQGDVMAVSAGSQQMVIDNTFNPDGSYITKRSTPWGRYEATSDMWGLVTSQSSEAFPGGAKARFNFDSLKSDEAGGKTSQAAQIAKVVPPPVASGPSVCRSTMSMSASGAKSSGSCGRPGGPGAGGGSGAGGGAGGGCETDCECVEGEDGCTWVCETKSKNACSDQREDAVPSEVYSVREVSGCARCFPTGEFVCMAKADDNFRDCLAQAVNQNKQTGTCAACREGYQGATDGSGLYMYCEYPASDPE